MSHESAPLLNRGASARDADGGRSGDDLASDVRGGRGWGNRAWLLALRRSGRRRDRHRGRVLIRHLPRLPRRRRVGGRLRRRRARVRASLRGAASARADRWSDFVSPDRATLGEANTALTAQMEQWYAQQPDLLHVLLDGPAPKVVQIVQPQERSPRRLRPPGIRPPPRRVPAPSTRSGRRERRATGRPCTPIPATRWRPSARSGTPSTTRSIPPSRSPMISTRSGGGWTGPAGHHAGLRAQLENLRRGHGPQRRRVHRPPRGQRPR